MSELPNVFDADALAREVQDALSPDRQERCLRARAERGKGERGKGEICLNGAAARKVEPGDVVIIMSYAFMTPDEARKFKPAIVFPDTHTNKIIE